MDWVWVLYVGSGINWLRDGLWNFINKLGFVHWAKKNHGLNLYYFQIFGVKCIRTNYVNF